MILACLEEMCSSNLSLKSQVSITQSTICTLALLEVQRMLLGTIVELD